MRGGLLPQRTQVQNTPAILGEVGNILYNEKTMSGAKTKLLAIAETIARSVWITHRDFANKGGRVDGGRSLYARETESIRTIC